VTLVTNYVLYILYIYLFTDTVGVEDFSFAKFMKFHRCYDVMPASSKLVVFDTELKVSLCTLVSCILDVTCIELHVNDVIYKYKKKQRVKKSVFRV